MLANFHVCQTSRHLLTNSTRLTLSTLPHLKSNKGPVTSDGAPINDSTLKPSIISDKIESIARNDLLDAKQFQINPSDSTVTNPDKFNHSSTSSSSATTATVHAIQESNTFVLPGVPIARNVSFQNKEQTTRSIDERQQPMPSSRFSAFLRSIRSGLPFFSSKTASTSTMDFASTREHFLPVCSICLTSY
jgi:hypothetical protein